MIRLDRDGDTYLLDLGDGDNRLSPDDVAAANVHLDTIEADDAPAVLITKSSGKIWCNGLDVEWMSSHNDEAVEYLGSVHDLLARVLVLPMPTIAAVTGHAFGAGALLSLAHDTRVMRSDRGYWCMPEVDLGMPFSPGFQALLTAKLHAATVNEAVTTGRRYGGDDARTAGIVEAAAPEADVVSTALVTAGTRAGKQRTAIGRLKADLYAEPAALLRGFREQATG